MSEGFISRRGGGGGGAGLNFRVLSGTTAPSSPKRNDIWINTDTDITGWHFGVEEPNVYTLQTRTESDAHTIVAPHQVSAGDVLNFEIPTSAYVTREALRILDPVTEKSYYIRNGDGTAAGSWSKGTMVGVLLSDKSMPIGSHGSGSGTALIRAWANYYHDEGEVWITTDTSSPVGFNALKKNGLMVYPLKASQYIGGTWVVKEASIYQSGEWVQFSSYWDGYYFKDGNQYEEITGGWSSEGWDNSGTANIGETLIVSANGNATGRMGIANPVDLTNVNTLWYDSPNGNNGASNSGYLCIADAKTYGSGNRVASTTIKNAGTGSIDVSNLSGEHYLYLYAMGSSGSQAYADIRAIWGE